jgi:transposase InsO family protein
MTRKKQKQVRRQARGRRQPLKGRRFTAEQRREALRLVGSGLKRTEVARMLQTTVESLRRWTKAQEAAAALASKTSAKAPPVRSRRGRTARPSDETPVTAVVGLAPVEVEAILALKKEHPSMGPAQIRAQLRRFRGWRLSVKAIARVLVRAGYRLVRKEARPEGQETFTRFEAPRRNALWQLDFVELRVGAERVYLLLVLDDFSRYVVGHKLAAEPSSEVAVETLTRAIAAHGKCEAVYTDRGGAFLAWRDRSGFQRYLEQELIEHHVSRPYRPQGRGKVEALIATLQRELWQVRHFESVADAEAATAAWIEHYNERRAHMGLDGLCPADRFFGRADAVRAQLAARVRGRDAAVATLARPGSAVEETGAVEVLRLVLTDGGKLELRVFGARVELGALTAA